MSSFDLVEREIVAEIDGLKGPEASKVVAELTGEAIECGWRPDSALFNQRLEHRVSAVLVELDTDLSPKLVG
jgi:hypothetical protein